MEIKLGYSKRGKQVNIKLIHACQIVDLRANLQIKDKENKRKKNDHQN